jgi:drug/metabolite transporter (DMT)-like permease
LIGVLFLHEQINPNEYIYIAVILFAGLFTAIDEDMDIKSFFQPAVAICVAAMPFLALSNVFINQAIAQGNDVWTANLWMTILKPLMLLVTLPWFYKDIFSLKIKNFTPLVLIGIFELIVNISAAAAYSVNVSISSVIISLPMSMVLVFLLSIFKPKLLEDHTFKVYAIRFGAAAIMIFAALRLSAI